MKVICKVAPRIALVLIVVMSQSACGRETISDQDRKALREGCQAVKASDKRTACMEVVDRLIQATPQFQTAESKPEKSAHELVMLKGVPFDKPGSNGAVMNLCLWPTRSYTTDELKKSEIWCKFSKYGVISMPDFNYGNLSGLSHATVDSEGSLISFETEGSKGEMLELAQLLGEKYGKSVVTDSQTENKLGKKFDKKTFIWIDQQGTRITIESIYNKIDTGRILINSASMIKTIDADQKIQKEVEKSKL